MAADLAARRYAKIITRFPPEPNGYLHIGHAKSISLNFGIAQEFGGQCNLRFDDTNPTKEEQEYIDAIKADVHWLGFDWGDHLYHASDYFEQLYAWAEHLIRNGLAYVDDQSQHDMRANRGTLTEPGRNSPFRDRTVAENLDLFRRMRAGEFPNGARVLRAKIDMASGNINLRDPVLYRILHASHPRTGTAWCIYPSYDFAHGQSDAIEGVTHSICTLEFEDHRPLYDWFLEHLPVPSHPHQYEFARLNLSYTVLSKRVLNGLVRRRPRRRAGTIPRMPTLAGLRRRGVPPEALRDFVKRIGVAKAYSVVDVAMFEHAIREVLNRTALRRMAVLRPLKIVIENYRRAGRGARSRQSPGRPRRRHAARAVRPRALCGARRLHGEPAQEVLPPVARQGGAAALRLFRHLPRGGEERRRRGRRAALHLRSGDARRQCPRRPQGAGDAALGRRRRRRDGRGAALQSAVHQARSRRRELRRRPQPELARGADATAKVEPALASGNSAGRGAVRAARATFARDKDSAPGRPVFNRTVGLRDTWGKVQGAGG